MPSVAHFRLTYDGPALESHEMEARELAPALLAVGDLLESANRALFGEKSEVKVNVTGSFKTGSFGIDFALVQGALSQVVDFFSSKEAGAVANALAILGALGFVLRSKRWGLIRVLKWIRNRPIKTVEIKETTAVLQVDEDLLEIELDVLALLQDYNTRREIENVFHRPLQNPGIDEVAVGTDDKVIDTVTRNEAEWFARPELPDEALDDVTFDATVQIARIEFNEENKWRFTDGATSFYANIEDEEFLRRISKNETAFAKDDILRVRVRKKQWLAATGMKSEYTILQVYEHRPAYRQIRLPLVVDQSRDIPKTTFDDDGS